MRRSVELQATNNVFQSGYKMDFWPAAAIMAEDQADGWLAGDGDGRELDLGGRQKWGTLPSRIHPEQMAIGLFGVGVLVLVTIVTKGLILLGQGGDRGPAEMT